MNNKLKLITSALALCVTFNVSLPVMATPEEASEASFEESKIKYQELNEEIKAINEKISSLDVDIEKINLDLEENNQKIEDTKTEIENTKNLLVQNENEMLEAETKLSIRIRSLYKTNLTSNMLLYLIDSESISDLFTRLSAVTRIISLDKALMEDIDAKKVKLENTVSSLKASEESLIALKEDIAENLREVESKKSEQQSFLDKLSEQRDEIYAVIEENEKILVENPLSIINSGSASVNQIQDAVTTLEGLIPQLNSSYVIGLAQDGINTGYILIEEATTPPAPEPDLNETGKKTYMMESTAYTGGGLTAMSLKPVRNPNGLSTVAVDPKVIPLGSKVYVSGYGVAIASDTGGAIKGHIVDVYFNTYNECINWGRRHVEVTVLAYPGEW